MFNDSNLNSQAKSKSTGQPKPITDKDIRDNRLVAAVSYIFLLCLLPLFGKKQSKFAQFHAKQGLILVIAWFVVWVVGIIPGIGWVVLVLGTISLLVLSLMGITNALAGKYWKMPFLGQYAEKINL